jgi:hypothetical protein
MTTLSCHKGWERSIELLEPLQWENSESGEELLADS